MRENRAEKAREYILRVLPVGDDKALEERICAETELSLGQILKKKTPCAKAARAAIYWIQARTFKRSFRAIYRRYGGCSTSMSQAVKEIDDILPEGFSAAPLEGNFDPLTATNVDFCAWYRKFTESTHRNKSIAARALTQRLLREEGLKEGSVADAVCAATGFSKEELRTKRMPGANVARRVLHLLYEALFDKSIQEIQKLAGYDFDRGEFYVAKGIRSIRSAIGDLHNVIFGVDDMSYDVAKRFVRVYRPKTVGLQLPEHYQHNIAGAQPFYLEVARHIRSMVGEVVPLEHSQLAVLGQAFDDCVRPVLEKQISYARLREELRCIMEDAHEAEQKFLLGLVEGGVSAEDEKKALRDMVPRPQFEAYRAAVRIFDIGCSTNGFRRMHEGLEDKRRQYMAEVIKRKQPSLVIVDAKHAQPLEKLLSGYEARIL